ncbi:hypothetical protein A6R68_01368 [Neotoma lepida]|uniref:Uncharacterized protein n=1 Tax=Neotoma lepida TaxID=56216 RepID=A0A1A6GUS8_NEOLE|nr:hypothetical protein A6R68_01368 [Neotoma lepida]
MEKISVSAFLLLVALSYTLAKDTTVKPGAKKDPKDSRPKLPQTLSRALKKVFADNKEIQKLAEQFVLLNLVYETTDKHLSPDGQYVPRVLFVGHRNNSFNTHYRLPGSKSVPSLFFIFADPSLTVRADITGRYSNRLYAYEPSDTALSAQYEGERRDEGEEKRLTDEATDGRLYEL